MNDQAQTADTKEADKKETKAKSSAAAIVVADGEIEIFPSRPLPEFDSFAAPAFEADDKRASTRQIVLLASRQHVPRVTVSGSYKNLKNAALLRLLDVGVVDWPDGQQYLAYVFDRPNGRKIMATADAKPLTLPEDRIIPAFIQPIVQLLAEIRNADIVHGAINLENMYLVGGEGGESIVLGECLTSAASARQHVIYEPIERAMAQPMGRGPGLYKDDLYALGVCVAMIVRGENLMAGRTPQEIIEDKIANTSYGILAGRDRLPNGIGEFLRGVLHDDEAQRWDIDDTLRWLEGRRHSPKQPRVHLKAARSYVFMEHKYWDLRPLARAFAEHVAEAAAEISSDQFDAWIKRNFEDKVLEARLEKIYEAEKLGAREKLVCQVCMALDPLAPVRYKKLAVFPRGFGHALADAVVHDEDMQIFADIVLQQIFNTWINFRHENMADSGNLISEFEKCRNFIAQKMPGYGLERVLYMLNAEVACMSPLFKAHIVLTPGHLLLALDDLAKKGGLTERFLDRHMIAFISVREPKMIDPHLGQLIATDRGGQVIGLLRTLAAIQRRFAVRPVPAISDHVISLIAPACDRVFDRDVRAELMKRVEKLKSKGDLGAILDLVDNDAILLDDRQRFALARTEYALLQRERSNLIQSLNAKKIFGYGTGRQVAMLTSAVVAMIVIVSYLVSHFDKG